MTNELDVNELDAEAIVDRLPEDLHGEWLTELEEFGLWVGKSEYERAYEERQLVRDYWAAIRSALRDLLTHRREVAAKKH